MMHSEYLHSSRVSVARRFFTLGFFALLLRLFHLQVIKGDFFLGLAENNRLRVVSEPALRGQILDRNGRCLARNRLMLNVAAIPQELREKDKVFSRLGNFVGLSKYALEDRFDDAITLPFVPAVLVADIAKDDALKIEERHLDLPGIMVQPVNARDYPLGPIASHLIGYLGNPSPESFPVLKNYGVKSSDMIGKSGLESELDSYLRGRSGGSLIEVDNRARQVRVMGERQSIPGKDIVLTIDANLQSIIKEQFGNQPGAAVVLRPRTGEVLAMFSSPGFDPQVFVDRDSEAIHWLLSDDLAAPLRNRATLGEYLPGSTVKPIVAIAALERGLINPKTRIHCPGYLTTGNKRIHCWKRDGHGSVNATEALMQSCNVYFMEVSRRLGLDVLRSAFMQVGFGRKTGWILGDNPGILPFGRWFSEGEIAMLGLGQGEITVTPLQEALAVSAIANGGWLMEPWVVKSIDSQSSSRISGIKLNWSEDTLLVVKEGMIAAVNDPNGTGIRAKSENIKVAGKTGTAQTGKAGLNHGWFIGFCPADDPQVAMAIVAEHGGSGGDVPASIGKSICEWFYAASVEQSDSSRQ